MKLFKEQVYIFNAVPENYNTAIKRCDEDFNGATLASVQSREEMDFILSLRPQGEGIFWIGGNRLFSQPWGWEDGTDFGNFQDWAAGEPANEASRQGCLSVQGDDFEAKWVDSKCRKKYFYVCKRDVLRKWQL